MLWLWGRGLCAGGQESLWTLRDLQGLGRLQSLAKDGTPSGNFGNRIGVDYIAAVGQRVAKRNWNVGSSGFQQEMLVADCRRSPVVGDGHDDDGEIEGVLGAIENLDDAVNPVIADLWKLKPFDQQ